MSPLNPISTPASGDTIRIIPLGGLGQVGMNCMIIEVGDQSVLIDAGITFPENDALGIDIILPDWSYVLESAERLSAIILTHGHEDHIGAMPFLMRDLNVPVYGKALTLGLLRHKLREHGLLDRCDLRQVDTGELIELTSRLSMEFIHVNHSIPDSAAVALYTPQGTILHTGDWRVDHTPIDDDPIDLPAFAELGDEGVLCLLGDSTNVSAPGASVSERAVLKGLEQIVEEAQGRVLVTMFSSNVHRLQGLLQIAHRHKRRVLLNGRSLLNMVAVARELGYLKVPHDDIFLSMGDLKRLPPSEILIVSTGSQGEPRSGLTRIAHDDHRQISVKPDDTVIFSARVVPGNEQKVNNVMNALWTRGVEVITPRDAMVHTTGHAYQEELKLMLNLTRPRHFVPVHGEPRMLIKHARLAQQLGIDSTHVLQNGHVLEIDRQRGVNVVGRVPSGRVLVDGKGVGDVNDLVVRDRMKLARAGIIVAILLLDTQTGEVVEGPKLLQQGVVERDESNILDRARDYALRALEDLNEESLKDAPEVAETLRVALQRFFRQKFDRSPVVVPLVTEA